MEHASGLVIEDVYTSVLVAGGGKAAIDALRVALSMFALERTSARLTRWIHMPKLPFVSNSLILSLDDVSHTLTRPSCVVLARYLPSSLRAMAHTSPALPPSVGRDRVSPRTAGGNRDGREKQTHKGGLLLPGPILGQGPELHVAPEAGARSPLAICRGDNVVAAELVGAVQGLSERKVGLGGGVHADAGGARG